MLVTPVAYNIQEQVLGYKPTEIGALKEKVVRSRLADFKLDRVDTTEYVPLPVPFGTVHEELERAIAARAQKHIDRLGKLAGLPTLDTPPMCPVVPGWQRYKGQWEPCLPPDNVGIVLDFETAMHGGFKDKKYRTENPKAYAYPTLCSAYALDGYWYIWQYDPTNLVEVIEFGHNCTVVGHNIGYDRRYLACEYEQTDTGNRFFDTMGAWIATHGMCNQQRGIYKLAQENELLDACLDWSDYTATNGLDAVYEFYTGTELDKGVRDELVHASRGLEWTCDNYYSLIRYGLMDIVATCTVLSCVYPELRATQGDVSLAGQLELGSTWFPMDGERWHTFWDRCEARYQETMQAVEDAACKALWSRLGTLEGLDSKVTRKYMNPAIAGMLKRTGIDASAYRGETSTGRQWLELPKWLADFISDPSLKSRTLILGLAATYRGAPIVWHEDGKNSGYWANGEPIPHPDKQGQRVTDLFAKGWVSAWESGVLAFSDANGAEFLDSFVSCLNWVSMRKRVAQMHTQAPDGFPVWLDDIVVQGTVTRRAASRNSQVFPNPKVNRIGTELKSMVAAPDGYILVGADVDQQEAWIGSILGDSYLGYCGSSPLGACILLGDKKSKTDIHSLSAASAGLDRDTAKSVLVFGTMYGQGLKGGTDGLVKHLKDKTKEQCQAIAQTFLDYFKGVKSGKSYVGGLASECFNKLAEVATGRDPVSPVLKVAMPKSLSSAKRDFATTKGNWVIQTSGVDFRDVLVLLTLYFFERSGVDGRLVVTIHDEARFCVKYEHRVKAAHALQLAHLYTRALFIDALGLDSIPASVAWFSEVDSDRYLRKDTQATCSTPTESGLEPGVSWSAADLMNMLT